jgi:hypothetical protein
MLSLSFAPLVAFAPAPHAQIDSQTLLSGNGNSASLSMHCSPGSQSVETMHPTASNISGVSRQKHAAAHASLASSIGSDVSTSTQSLFGSQSAVVKQGINSSPTALQIHVDPQSTVEI